MGLERAHWVESFLSAWFIHGLNVQGCEKAFFREWQEMWTFAWSRENWWRTEVRTNTNAEELFQHLMGFGFGNGYVKDTEYRPFIAAMKPEFDRWADEFLQHPKSAKCYARFLTFPSAVNHVRDGMRRLSIAIAQFEERHWRDCYHLDSALLDLLEYDWRLNSHLIKNDANVRRQFTTILKTMSDRQIPRALEFQDQIARSV